MPIIEITQELLDRAEQLKITSARLDWLQEWSELDCTTLLDQPELMQRRTYLIARAEVQAQIREIRGRYYDEGEGWSRSIENLYRKSLN